MNVAQVPGSPSRGAASGVARSALGLAMIAIAALEGPKAARAAEPTTEYATLDVVVKDIARNVAAIMKRQPNNPTDLHIVGFNDEYDAEKNGGAKLRDLLVVALKGENIEVKNKSDLKLKGEIEATYEDSKEDPSHEVPLITVDFELDQKGVELPLLVSRKFAAKAERAGKGKGKSKAKTEVVETKEVTSPREVANVVGMNIDVKPGDKKALEKKVVDGLKKNTMSPEPIVVEGNKIRPEKGSKFAVEILRTTKRASGAPPRDAYEPVTPQLIEGVPYVQLHNDDVYAIKIYNDNSFMIGAAVSIDGVDMFRFSDKKDLQNYWILNKAGDPLSSYPVYGFHRTGSKFDVFEVGEYSKADAAKLLISDDSKLSQISVEFRAAWLDDKDRPADEGKTGYGSPATYPGASTEVAIEEVPATMGKFRSLVTIRYNHPPDLPPK